MKASRKKRGKREPAEEKTPVRGFSVSHKDLLLAAVLVVMVVAAFSPAFRCGFIWDDDAYVTQNYLLSAPDGLFRIWFTMDSPSQYFPLVYTTFRIEHSIWGLHPLGYHTVNILMHAANAILVWLLLAQLGIPGAWLAAAIWAVHPVQVESVAWVTERKNVLSTLFYLLSLLSWNAFLDRPEKGRRHYGFALVMCALALFAKTTACTIPAAMLIMAWWKRRPIDKRRVLQVAPFVVMSLLMGLVTMWWEKVHQGTSGEIFNITPVERLLIGGRAIWFYLEKLIFPRELAFSYPQWSIQPSNPLQYLPVAALIAAAVVLWTRRQAARGLIGAALFFTIVLAPMLGLFTMWTFRYTYVADHYQYLACLGPIAWFAAATTKLKAQAWRASVAVVVLATLCTLSFLYTRVYKSEETIWWDVLAKNPRSFMAYNNLGKILYERGERDEGIRFVKKAIEINPTNSEAHLNLGVVLNKAGHVDEAIEQWELAVKYLPNYERAHRELCVALKGKHRLDEAIEHGEVAVTLEPQNPLAHLNLGSALAPAGRVVEATEHFRAAVHYAPDMAEAHFSLGMALSFQGNIDAARTEFDQALAINPALTAKLAQVLFANHDYAGAWEQVHAALRLGQPIAPGFLRALSQRMPDPGGG